MLAIYLTGLAPGTSPGASITMDFHFSLYPGLWDKVLGPNFHDYEQLGTDLKNGTAPQVIIVEPSYQDAPHIGPDHPNDNHPPLAVGWGEDLLRRTYQSAIMNPDIWAQTLMVVYYDEHGGFFDHVPPPAIDNAAAGNANPPAPYAFDTFGPRIPAILIPHGLPLGRLAMTNSTILRYCNCWLNSSLLTAFILMPLATGQTIRSAASPQHSRI